ncbi:hypothetical protein SPRG_07250 [Saprolegnia parasitica CBS 223.65]|uniref:Kinesin-like protein n=1 Tax=Saprolegnia parasitica (strain CBS 223.65) TaxID=695850 RepID=A0A067CBT3_SAPPC|nr:hypothetical protein SPRG_07250 [Saprolegnia parasitica CBS 223.65]KDO27973.1 hypothetical protein SPRG_07250 [Saprolegnia parasitica CBS 223.65]|eukprot:XP_012201422.1 hypothetical protein SPRG_07250 [Saprolegnia parasitica CBS 223.65]
MSNRSESVKVVVRIRPLSTKEKQDGRTYIVFSKPAEGEISLNNPEADDREPPKKFTFDASFGPDSEQIDVYNLAARDIVESAVDGFNGTIFAYGQTGAGKSHTMEGYNDPPELRGIIPNSFKHIFDKIGSVAKSQFMVCASYLEIYNEEIRDLLAPDPQNHLELKENMDTGVYVKDLIARQVTGVAEIDAVMQQGKKNRSVGATLMNQTSSRSHSMFIITVETASTGVDGKDHICVGKLNLVDLAGSERQAKTGATGDRMKEATKINLSLSALGNVISALVDGKSQHIPYRDSKLTRLLQDSLGGNAKTVMIANCGPADYNYNETLSTLRYANRAKNIKNKPKINEDPKDAKIREFQEKIKELREALAAQEKGLVTTMVDGKEVKVQATSQAPQIVEKIVEKTIVRREGVSEDELKKLQEDALREKNELKKRAQMEMKALLASQSKTEEEREKLAAQLHEKAQAKERLEKKKTEMLSQLAEYEEKVIMGGQVLDKAARQELELRDAQQKIDEQKRQEMQLARELAEREDSNLLLEEQFSSLQEEVDVKTKKLKKLWAKHKAASTEIEDLRTEFQAEKEDMLETIRELTRQLKIKHFLLHHFVPLDDAYAIEQRSKWDKELDEWKLEHLETRPTSLRPKRPIARRGARRAETECARRNRQMDRGNPRWKSDNVILLELEMPERRTRDYESGMMGFWLDRIASNEDESEIIFESEAPEPEKKVPAGPTLSDAETDAVSAETKAAKATATAKKSTKSRPPTASRRRRESVDET